MKETYVLLLLALYKINSIEESGDKLPLLLDRKSWDNLLNYYGGRYIYVPSRKEFSQMCNAFLLYKYIEIDGMSVKEAEDKLGLPTGFKTVKRLYDKIKENMSNLEIEKILKDE